MNRKSRITVFLALIVVALAAPRAGAAELDANPPYTLNVDIYSGFLPHDSLREQHYDFELGQLRKGNPPGSAFVEFYPRVIHLSHRTEKDFLIGQSGEANGEKIVAVAHVTKQSDGKLNIAFSELGRPPAYEGATGLVVCQGEQRVFELPAIATANGDGTLRTVVVVSTPANKVDQNGRSRFEGQ
jgi:hypothetical protein